MSAALAAAGRTSAMVAASPAARLMERRIRLLPLKRPPGRAERSATGTGGLIPRKPELLVAGAPMTPVGGVTAVPAVMPAVVPVVRPGCRGLHEARGIGRESRGHHPGNDVLDPSLG